MSVSVFKMSQEFSDERHFEDDQNESNSGPTEEERKYFGICESQIAFFSGGFSSESMPVCVVLPSTSPSPASSLLPPVSRLLPPPSSPLLTLYFREN
jgi:hypothetical protein